MINASACVREADQHNYAVQYIPSFIPGNRYSELDFVFIALFALL
jgi:hypothetical protein